MRCALGSPARPWRPSSPRRSSPRWRGRSGSSDSREMAMRPVHVVSREVPPEFQLRMAVAIGVVCAAFALVGLRLWYLQVERGAQMRYYSEKNRIRLVRVPAPRGVVYDRNGEILIDNRPSFDVVFVPEDAGERRRQVLRTLAGYLGEEEAGLHQGARAPGGEREHYQGIVLRRDVDWQGVDALGRRVRVLQEEPDRSGGTLTLTLDRDLQEAADRALGEADGAIVALDPRSGEVLAMVSHPSFDPNVFARGIRSAEWRTLVEDRKHPLNNRAVQGVFPPGSTFKVAVATGALEEGVVTPFTGVTCTGGMPFGNHFFHCWKKGGHGAVDLHKAIVESCDVFFYQVGRRLGVDGIAEYAHRLGLGLPTGIALPHEQTGTIPDREWKRRRFSQPWFEGETLSVAIGQGYVTATPLQMANLAATIASGGTRRRPLYGKRAVGTDGNVLEVEPEVLGEAHLKKSTLAQVREGMREVVMSESGTGKKARVTGIVVAGKTGTSQVVKMGEDRARANRGTQVMRDHAWFIAFAPFDAPEIAIACIVEHAGGGGGAIAAPVVQQVLAHYFGRNQGPAPPAREANALRPPTDHAL